MTLDEYKAMRLADVVANLPEVSAAALAAARASLDAIAEEPHGEDDAIALRAAIAAARAIMALSDVDAERDRRIAAGFVFQGVTYQARPYDRENIAGAAQLAFMALAAGAQAGDLRWHGGADPFAWIAADNALVPMDAPTVIAFAKAAAGHQYAHIFAGRAIKDRIAQGEVIADVGDGALWP